MPTSAGNVGPQLFPDPVTGPDAPFPDPTALVLGHYLAHWLNFGLDARAKSMKPKNADMVHVDADGIPDAVFTFDPKTTFVRRTLPAIYVWCLKAKPKEHSTIRDIMVSEYHVRWYFLPINVPYGIDNWSGLTQGAHKLMYAANFDKRHETFPPSGLTLPVSFPIGTSVEKALCLRELEIVETDHGMTWETPGTSPAPGGTLGSVTDGARQRGFPTVMAKWTVEEFVDIGRPTIADERGDILLSIKASDGESSTAVDMFERFIQHPDGTDDPGQKSP